jgi:hypothetical protein
VCVCACANVNFFRKCELSVVKHKLWMCERAPPEREHERVTRCERVKNNDFSAALAQTMASWE